MEMERKKLEFDWHQVVLVDFEMPLRRYRRYLEDQGFRGSTVESYVGNVGRYLKFAKTDRPTTDTATCFRDTLHDKNLARSTINNYSFAIASRRCAEASAVQAHIKQGLLLCQFIQCFHGLGKWRHS
jgi:hypothetical protein